MGDPVRVPSAASTEPPAPTSEAALQAPPSGNGLSSAAEPARASVAEHEASASSTRTYRWLAVAASVLLVLAAIALTLDRRLETRLALQRAQAFELHVRAHRLALDAQALTTDAQGFQPLQDSGQRFAAALAALEHPSMQAASAASANAKDVAAMLVSLREQWNALQPNLQSLGSHREAVQEASVRQQAIAAQTQPLATLLQRLSRSATEVRLEPGLAAALRQVEGHFEPARLAYLPLALAAPNPDPTLFPRLREQMSRAAAALAVLLRERPPSPVAESAEALREALQPALSEIERLHALAPQLTRARASALEIASATDALANDAAAVVRSFPPSSFAVSRWMWAGVAAGVAAFGCLLWILQTMLTDAERRAASSLQSAARSRQAHQRTQDAILRLLDELSRLAHGDLTVRVDVADEATGAVADAINYAVSELRRLVLGIHGAADRLAEACAEAQAGQTLKRIDEHVQNLALLTEAISTATQAESEAARGIDSAKAEVAAVSELAAEATRKSAERGAQLAALARELKELVAGFKAF